MITKYLVIDDDPINNTICSYTIRKVVLNSEVKCFENPVEGLAFITNEYTKEAIESSTVLLLDINMPEMNGWEFLEEFAKMNPAVQAAFSIYIVSSSIDEKDMERAKENRFVRDFLSKPLGASIIERLASPDTNN
jgi:response regulator RpfG family c-di-GMP phosphodiesterase